MYDKVGAVNAPHFAKIFVMDKYGIVGNVYPMLPTGGAKIIPITNSLKKVA